MARLYHVGIFIVALTLTLAGCNPAPPSPPSSLPTPASESDSLPLTPALQVDTLVPKQNWFYPNEDLDSAALRLRREAQQLPAQSLERAAMELYADMVADHDYAAQSGAYGFIDINGDGARDMVLEFYGAAGTGIKNHTDVVLWDAKRQRFHDPAHPYDFVNAFLDLNRHQLWESYLGNGSGYGFHYQWKGFKLDTLEELQVGYEEENQPPGHRPISITDYKTKNSKALQELPHEFQAVDYQRLIEE